MQGDFFVEKKNLDRIHITVIPKAKKEIVKRVCTESDISYRVYVKEIPESGKANRAVIKLLAKTFATSPSNIKIIHGLYINKKIIQILDQDAKL